MQIQDLPQAVLFKVLKLIPKEERLSLERTVNKQWGRLIKSLWLTERRIYIEGLALRLPTMIPYYSAKVVSLNFYNVDFRRPHFNIFSKLASCINGIFLKSISFELCWFDAEALSKINELAFQFPSLEYFCWKQNLILSAYDVLVTKTPPRHQRKKCVAVEDSSSVPHHASSLRRKSGIAGISVLHFSRPEAPLTGENALRDFLANYVPSRELDLANVNVDAQSFIQMCHRLGNKLTHLTFRENHRRMSKEKFREGVSNLNSIVSLNLNHICENYKTFTPILYHVNLEFLESLIINCPDLRYLGLRGIRKCSKEMISILMNHKTLRLIDLTRFPLPEESVNRIWCYSAVQARKPVIQFDYDNNLNSSAC